MNELPYELIAEIDRLSSLPSVYLRQLHTSPFSTYFLEIQQRILSNNPRQILYHAIQSEVPLCVCGASLQWNIRSYRKFCSSECSNKSNDSKQKAKETLIKNYGVDHISKATEVKNKKAELFFQKYGVTNPFQLEFVKDQIKSTNLERYGVENVSQSEIIKQKTKETNLEKYGVEYASQNSDVQEKVKQTNLLRYNVEWSLQAAAVREKGKQTNLERYGVEYPAQAACVQDKMKSTTIERYGVENVSQVEACQQKKKTTIDANYGKGKKIHWSRKHFTEDACDFLANDILFSTCVSTTPVKKLASIFNISVTTIHKKIRELGIVRVKASCFETEIAEFVRNNYNGIVHVNDRMLIKPKEIDIYLPELNLAIECDGSYYHGEIKGRDQKYHLNKTNACNKQNINLFHIWQHDWDGTKRHIIESMLLHKLGKTSTKIYARKCLIKEVSKEDANIFFENNHLQGTCAASVRFGLYYENELVSCMSFSKPRFNKNFDWELVRFANKMNHSVVGGATKLLKHFIKNNQPNNIISYSDRMHSVGKVYSNMGFIYLNTSKPSYKYTIDYSTVFNRVKFQKHKLSTILEYFDPLLTEWDNMQINGYDRIWDCGNDVWVWKNNSASII